MPLTANLDAGTLVDATCCPDDVWKRIHRASQRADLTCRGCGSGVHAKVSNLGLRFFAHDSRQDSCPSAGETPEHRRLKFLVAEAIRAAGAEADVEASPASGDAGGWRADVLALVAGGRRVAFEVQLAAMTLTEGQERSAKYAVDGIATVWLTTKNPPWLYQLPSARVLDGDGSLQADRGMARLVEEEWAAAGLVDFGRVIAGLLNGSVVPCEVDFLHERVGGRSWGASEPTALVARVDRDRWLPIYAEMQAAAARERAEWERRFQASDEDPRAAALRALYERQERVLQEAVRLAVADAKNGETVWLGIPAEPWAGTGRVPLQAALGDASTGQGCVVWLHDGHGQQRLASIVCPVANRVDPLMGASWRNAGVRVLVETSREASRVAHALGLPIGLLTAYQEGPQRH